MPTGQAIVRVLERSRNAGFLGPGPLGEHIDHAKRYAAALGSTQGLHVLDIGSGGGLPGLVIFSERQDLTGCLLDAMAKRTAFLEWAVAELGISNRVEVVRGRTEDLGHDPRYRSQFDAVLARSFGPPPATVEAALGFMKARARLVISEPPGGRAWPDLSHYGLHRAQDSQTPEGTAVFDSSEVAPAHIPRPIRKQQRQPLF